MNHLTLHDLYTFLVFLLRTRRTEVDAIPSAAAFALTMDPTLAEIEALPPEDLGGAPNAEALEQTDQAHDDDGTSLYYLALAYKTSRRVSAEAKAAAKLILDDYVPAPIHLRASYATEAARGESRQANLAEHQPILDRIPVEGGTAHAWVTGYVESALRIGELLSDRADETGDRSDALPLRTEAMSDVRLLREIVAKALRRDPRAARAADHRLFNYLDMLAALRDSGSNEPAPPPPPDEPTPVPTPVA